MVDIRKEQWPIHISAQRGIWRLAIEIPIFYGIISYPVVINNDYCFCFQLNVKFFTSPVGKLNESVNVLNVNLDVCKFLRKDNRGNILTTYFLKIIRNYGKIPNTLSNKNRKYIFPYNWKDTPRISFFLGTILHLQSNIKWIWFPRLWWIIYWGCWYNNKV